MEPVKPPGHFPPVAVGCVKLGASVTVPVDHDVSKHLNMVLRAFANDFSIYVHELYPDAFITSEVTVNDVE